eukprot:12490000-Ditylum_brightwellii.AAC.1
MSPNELLKGTLMIVMQSQLISRCRKETRWRRFKKKCDMLLRHGQTSFMAQEVKCQWINLAGV